MPPPEPDATSGDLATTPPASDVHSDDGAELPTDWHAEPDPEQPKTLDRIELKST